MIITWNGLQITLLVSHEMWKRGGRGGPWVDDQHEDNDDSSRCE